MKACEGRIGRVFMLRLEDDDVLPSCIESFAADNGIRTAQVVLVGGVGAGEIVVGPRGSGTTKPEPMLIPVDGAHEVLAVGVLAQEENGRPVLHIHGALGRSGHAVAGCLRPGVRTWLVAEAVVFELTGLQVSRRLDARSGFSLLEVHGPSAG